MDSLLNRYRNITVLLLVVFAQMLLLAVQVRNDQDVRMNLFGMLGGFAKAHRGQSSRLVTLAPCPVLTVRGR